MVYVQSIYSCLFSWLSPARTTMNVFQEQHAPLLLFFLAFFFLKYYPITFPGKWCYLFLYKNTRAFLHFLLFRNLLKWFIVFTVSMVVMVKWSFAAQSPTNVPKSTILHSPPIHIFWSTAVMCAIWTSFLPSTYQTRWERDKPIIKKLFFDFSTLSKHHNKTNIITKPGRESSIGGGINNSHLYTLNFFYSSTTTHFEQKTPVTFISSSSHEPCNINLTTDITERKSRERYREIQTEARWVPFVLFLRLWLAAGTSIFYCFFFFLAWSGLLDISKVHT